MSCLADTLSTRRFHDLLVSPHHPESPGENPLYGFVEKTFRRSAWVRLQGVWAPRILTLQSEELGLGPLGVSLPPRAPLPQERDRFDLEGRRVTLTRPSGGRRLFSFSLQGPGQELGSHAWRAPMDVGVLLDHAAALGSAREDPLRDTVQRSTPRKSTTIQQALDRAKNKRHESFKGAFWQLFRGAGGGGEEGEERGKALRVQALRRCCLELIGMGEGLTPAGDDFLVACAALSRRMACSGFQAQEPDELFRSVLGELACGGKTTPAGEEMLHWAARGVFLEPLGRVVALLGDPGVSNREIKRAADPLLDVGGSSGREMLSALRGVVLHHGFSNGRSSRRH